MNKVWYKLAGWVVLLAGLVLILINLQTNGLSELFYGTPSPNYWGIIMEGILGSIGVFIAFFFPGKYLLKLKEKNYNKLTNWSVILILVGLVLMILVAFWDFLIFRPGDDLRGLMTLFFGIFPAGALYAISVLLLIINYFKNKK